MISEQEIFAFLARHYVQQQDERQRFMGLQYTTAETHDLAKQIHALIRRAAALTDEQLVGLMLQATGEDWDESDVWKLRMFIKNATGVEV